MGTLPRALGFCCRAGRSLRVGWALGGTGRAPHSLQGAGREPGAELQPSHLHSLVLVRAQGRHITPCPHHGTARHGTAPQGSAATYRARGTPGHQEGQGPCAGADGIGGALGASPVRQELAAPAAGSDGGPEYQDMGAVPRNSSRKHSRMVYYEVAKGNDSGADLPWVWQELLEGLGTAGCCSRCCWGLCPEGLQGAGLLGASLAGTKQSCARPCCLTRCNEPTQLAPQEPLLRWLGLREGVWVSAQVPGMDSCKDENVFCGAHRPHLWQERAWEMLHREKCEST